MNVNQYKHSTTKIMGDGDTPLDADGNPFIIGQRYIYTTMQDNWEDYQTREFTCTDYRKSEEDGKPWFIYDDDDDLPWFLNEDTRNRFRKVQDG